MAGSPIRPIVRPICQPIIRGINTLVGGTSAPSLPSGAIGVWYADQYQSTPRPYLPNEITKATNTPSANLMAPGRRLFANNNIWSVGGTITRTDNAATGPDGATEASTLVCSGNWYLYPGVSKVLPAGTYTMACNVKRNTGSDQSFCFSKDTTATRSSVKTATSGWTRESYTFTLGAPSTTQQTVLCSIDGVTAANIQVCDFELYSGSSDLGPEVKAGHFYVGANGLDTVPTYASGALDLSTGGYGFIQFPTLYTIGNVTAVMLVSKIAAGSSFQSMMSKVQSYAEFSPHMEANTRRPTTSIKTEVSFNPTAGLWDFLNKGYHFFAHRYNGTSRDIFLDDMKPWSQSGAVATFTLQDMFAGIVNGTSLPTGYKLSAMALYNSALSDAQIETARAALYARAVALSPAPLTRFYFAEGHSIPATGGSYAYIFGPNSSPAVVGGVKAVGGSTLATMTARGAAIDALLPTNRTGRKFILTVDIGTNDLYSYAGGSDAAAVANYVTDLTTYLNARRAAGWLTVGMPVLPRSDGSLTAPQIVTHNIRRALLKTTQLTMVGSSYDAFADWSGDATMWPDAASLNVTYYPDAIHPSAAGHALLEPYVRTAINAL